MHRLVIFLLTLCIPLGCCLMAQDQTAPRRGGQYAGLYGSVLYHSTSDFPVTQSFSEYSTQPLAFKSSASSGGIALGYFTTLFSTRQGYAGLELAYSWSNFSDPNVQKKSFHFFDLFLHFGLAPAEDARLALYGIFGGGLLYHSEEDESDLGPFPLGPSAPLPSGPPPDYYLATSVGAVMWGFGVRARPMGNLVLSFEYKWMYDSSSELDMDRPVPGMEDWYYTKSSFDPIGNRLSIGISYVFSILE
jgi:hypothetical protein